MIAYGRIHYFMRSVNKAICCVVFAFQNFLSLYTGSCIFALFIFALVWILQRKEELEAALDGVIQNLDFW